MKIRLKKFLNKYKNRIFSFIAVFAFLPFFSINSSAAVIYDGTKDFNFKQRVYLEISDNGVVNSNLNPSRDVVFSEVISELSNNETVYRTSSVSGRISGDTYLFQFYYPDTFTWINSVYDYYLVGSFFTGTSNTFDFVFDNLYLYQLDGDSYFPVDYSNLERYYYNNSLSRGLGFSAKIDSNNIDNIARIVLNNSTGNGYLSSNLSFWFSIVPIEKGNEVPLQSIVSAINNQTNTLGGKIDDTNDFIDKGNSSTSGIVSGNNSAIDNLDEVVSEYHATEQQFFDDFNTNQQAITSDIVGWSWGGLVNCANWVGSTMTDYYNNMGDFRQYIIYPLMLGIVLFFLGRGGSIIGHLFRKPTETTVNTKSVFRREGNTRYTTTTTSRQGGVFRK